LRTNNRVPPLWCASEPCMLLCCPTSQRFERRLQITNELQAAQLVMQFIQRQVTQSLITMTIAGAWMCGRRMGRLEVVMLVNLILVLGPITGAFAQTSCSRNFTVGGAGQLWTIPSDPDFYQNWSASIQFLPGDCLCKYTETGNFFPRLWISQTSPLPNSCDAVVLGLIILF
jgi:hypothetical protein